MRRCRNASDPDFAGYSVYSQGFKASSGGHRKLWSACMDPSLRWTHMQPYRKCCVVAPPNVCNFFTYILASTLQNLQEDLCDQRRLRSACTSAQSDQSALIACAFNSLRAIPREINENPCHTGWMYRLIWAFAGHTGLTSGFVVRWLKEKLQSTLVVSNSKGLTETLRDIRISTYQSWESEENNKLNNHI